MKHLLLIYFFMFSIMPSGYAMQPAAAQPCPPVAQNQRDLIILADVSGHEALKTWKGNSLTNDAQRSTLATSLSAQAAPILVPVTTWRRISSNLSSELVDWYRTLDYEVYQLDNYLLWIPALWKKRFNISDTAFNLDKVTRITNPLALGGPTNILEPLKDWGKSAIAEFNIYPSLVKVLRTLLKPKSFAWNIVVYGHGGKSTCSTSIAGMPYAEFKILLQFLEKEITTNILLYSSCYAGGKDLLEVYKTGGNPDIYHFPIILTGFTESISLGARDDELESVRDFFVSIRDAPLCITYQNKLGLIAGALLGTLIFSKNLQKYIIIAAENILQIRWPRATQFRVIPLENLVHTTHSTSSTDTVHIKEHAYIMDKPFIDQNLVFDDDFLDGNLIASGIPRVWHYIKSISLKAQSKNPDYFMRVLFNDFRLEKLESSKVFLIDTVTNLENKASAHTVLVFLNTSTPSTSWFNRMLNNISELFYMEGDQGYRILRNAEAPFKVDQTLTQQYQKLFNEQKKKLFDEYLAPLAVPHVKVAARK